MGDGRPENGENPWGNQQDPPPAPRKGRYSDRRVMEKDGAITLKNGGVGTSRDKRLQGGTRNSNQERTEGPYTCSSKSASQSRTGTYDSRELVDIIENQNQAIKRLELEVHRLSKTTPGTQKGKAKEKQA